MKQIRYLKMMSGKRLQICKERKENAQLIEIKQEQDVQM